MNSHCVEQLLLASSSLLDETMLQYFGDDDNHQIDVDGERQAFGFREPSGRSASLYTQYQAPQHEEQLCWSKKREKGTRHQSIVRKLNDKPVARIG